MEKRVKIINSVERSKFCTPISVAGTSVTPKTHRFNNEAMTEDGQKISIFSPERFRPGSTLRLDLTRHDMPGIFFDFGRSSPLRDFNRLAAANPLPADAIKPAETVWVTLDQLSEDKQGRLVAGTIFYTDLARGNDSKIRRAFDDGARVVIRTAHRFDNFSDRHLWPQPDMNPEPFEFKGLVVKARDAAGTFYCEEKNAGGTPGHDGFEARVWKALRPD